MLMKLVRKNQHGIGLLELMLSLSIIAILLVMATRYFIVTNRSQKVNQVVTTLNSVVAAVNVWKGNRAVYTGLTAAMLNDAGLLAGQDYDATDGIVTAIGPVTLTAAATSYTLAISNVPGWACYGLEAKYASADGTINPNAKCSAYDGTGTFTYVPTGI